MRQPIAGTSVPLVRRPTRSIKVVASSSYSAKVLRVRISRLLTSAYRGQTSRDTKSNKKALRHLKALQSPKLSFLFSRIVFDSNLLIGDSSTHLPP